jgi:beta-galactosidase
VKERVVELKVSEIVNKLPYHNHSSSISSDDDFKNLDTLFWMYRAISKEKSYDAETGIIYDYNAENFLSYILNKGLQFDYNVEYYGDSSKLNLPIISNERWSLWRVSTDNDEGGNPIHTSLAEQWRNAGFNNLEVRNVELVDRYFNERMAIKIKGNLQNENSKFNFETTYTLYGTGDIHIKNKLIRQKTLSTFYKTALPICLLALVLGFLLLRSEWNNNRFTRILLKTLKIILLPIILIGVGFTFYSAIQDYNKNVPLPKVGTQYTLPQDFQHFEWYGNDVETYADRQTGGKIGHYQDLVENQYIPYIRPQENGNHSETRWAMLMNSDSIGLLVIADDWAEGLNVSVQDYDDADLEKATHSFRRGIKGGKFSDNEKAKRFFDGIPYSQNIYLNIDYKQSGVGGDNSWQPRTHEKYLLKDDVYEWSYRMCAIDLKREKVADRLGYDLPKVE